MSFFYNLLSIEDLIVDNNIDIDPEFIHPLILVSIYLCISFGLMFAFKMIKHYYAYQSFILENKNNYYFNKTLNDFKSSIFIDCYLYIYGGLFLLFFFFFQFFMLLIDCDCNEDSEFIFYSKFNNFYFIPETFIDEKDLSSKFNFISDYFVVKGDYSDDFKMFSTLSDKQISEMADRVVSVDIAKHRLLTFIESDLISSMEELSEVENLKSRFSNLYNLDPVEFNTNFINEYNKFLDFKRASVSSYKNFKTSFFSGKFSSSTFFNTDSGFNYLSNNKLENRFISDELPYFLYKSPYDITQAYGRYFYNKDIIYKGYAEAYADLYHLTIKAEIARLNYIDRLLLPEIKSELVNLNKFCIAHFHKASPLYIDNSYKSLEYIYDSFKDFNTKRLILTMEFAHVDYDLISYFYTGDGKYADR